MADTLDGRISEAAGRWGIDLTEQQRMCSIEKMAEELDVAPDEPFDSFTAANASAVNLAFYFVGCDVDLTVTTLDTDPAPALVAVIESLLVDDDVAVTPAISGCVTSALVEVFGDRLVPILRRAVEPKPADNTDAAGAIDACGIDGVAFVDG